MTIIKYLHINISSYNTICSLAKSIIHIIELLMNIVFMIIQLEMPINH